jgi:hypothetical protein
MASAFWASAVPSLCIKGMFISLLSLSLFSDNRIWCRKPGDICWCGSGHGQRSCGWCWCSRWRKHSLMICCSHVCVFHCCHHQYRCCFTIKNYQTTLISISSALRKKTKNEKREKHKYYTRRIIQGATSTGETDWAAGSAATRNPDPMTDAVQTPKAGHPMYRRR